MSEKIKTILFIMLFFVLIASSVFIYNKLKAQNQPALVIEEGTESTSEEEIKKVTESTKGDEIAIETEQAEVEAKEDKNKAFDVTIYDKEGNAIKISDMKGKPIVLNFWASWCPPCKEEMPHFETLYTELGEEVQFVMVDLVDGAQETVESGLKYVEQQGFTFPVFFDTSGEAGMTYGIRSIPTTIFIDKEGYMVTGAQGAIDEDALRKGIDMVR